MKKFFILFLVSNFYNIHSSLPDDIKSLAIITFAILNQKNLREFSFKCEDDKINGKTLRISTGYASSKNYILNYHAEDSELQTVQRSLPDQHGNPELNKLLQVIKMKSNERVRITSYAPRIGNWQ